MIDLSGLILPATNGTYYTCGLSIKFHQPKDFNALHTRALVAEGRKTECLLPPFAYFKVSLLSHLLLAL